MKIEFPRGDLYKQRFVVKNLDGSLYDEDFQDIYFTVKRSHNDNKFIFQKRYSDGGIVYLQNAEYQFTINPEDTDGLRYGTYVFDIELVDMENEIKQTFTGELIITHEVTFPANE